MRKLIVFTVMILLGLGWADCQVHELRDGQGVIEVYGWRTQHGTVEGVWLGDVYPLFACDASGNVRLIAGGLDYDLTELGRSAMQIAEKRYGEMRLRWQAMIEKR